VKTSDSIVKLSGALCQAQAANNGALKDSTNPFFKSKYADLESVIEAIRLPFATNGLSFIQGVLLESKVVATRIIHASGEWIETYYPLDCKEWTNPQSVGSAMTYAKRYGLQAAAGIPTVDDDGNSAAVKPSVSNPIQAAKAEYKNGNSGEFVIGFGKHKGLKLSELDIHDLNSYVEYIQSSALRDGKEITGKVKEFMVKAGEFMDTRKPSNQPKEFNDEFQF